MERIAFLYLCLMPMCKLFVCVSVSVFVHMSVQTSCDWPRRSEAAGLWADFHIPTERGSHQRVYLHFIFVYFLMTQSHNWRKFLSFCYCVLLSHVVYCSQRYPSAIKKIYDPNRNLASIGSEWGREILRSTFGTLCLTF